ncbi:phytoene/squalene synthase family protein [Aurantibacter crassamenti]|uniref:phytoene/squalene synthase family protein n=1 Tax=Aurantibacter crassamenti TaxID=1837375 RepID=UPI001939C691|nr:phytoene/squalene synthase family protein [Aurantibacter crassamenti]MBM1104816.1 phytoene/squalene synthase family protein [Aurantibacter crassamenti]
MKELFDNSSYDCSKLVTKTYSTSFSMGIKMFSPKIRPAIYAIYGFVRYADEIVDTFHDYQQLTLFDEFEQDYYKALERKISLNPILNAFQEIVHKYDLKDYVQDFMDRMRMDLDKKEYTSKEEYENYIYGSADVVGLMCLRVFVNNDEKKYNELKGYAMRLGSAFQKVNFLRDIREDNEELGRSYFPNLVKGELTEQTKAEIILDVENDFKEAYKGIVLLPIEGKLGVYLAYRYYLRLLQKIKKADCKKIMNGRIRVSNSIKLVLLTKAVLRYRLNFI